MKRHRLPVVPYLSDAMTRIRADIVINENGCWIWQGATWGNGYGRVTYQGRSRRTHAVAYEAVKGAIPKGLVLDHLCRTPLCCNPAHLEAVTHRENILRGVGGPAANATKTHCIHGHEFTPENTHWYQNKTTIGFARACKACHRINIARWRDLRRGDRPKFYRKPKTHCRHGHRFTAKNTMWNNGKRRYRICRTCRNAYARAWKARRIT